MSSLKAAKQPARSQGQHGDIMFIAGDSYRRRVLHNLYGGQQQGGISTPKAKPFILLFTGPPGDAYGYKDDWHEGIFYYTGEGQRGHMRLVAGNKAIAGHANAGKDLYLFQEFKRSHVRFLGQFVCVGHHTRRGPDIDGNERDALVFELVPIAEFTLEKSLEDGRTLQTPQTLDLATLRLRAITDSAETREPTERKAFVRLRSDAIRKYVLGRAKGICEGCQQTAPFLPRGGEPYLEPHHIRRLSDGGPDRPDSVAAVCANCHRRAHYSVDAEDFNNELADRVKAIEAEFEATFGTQTSDHMIPSVENTGDNA